MKDVAHLSNVLIELKEWAEKVYKFIDNSEYSFEELRLLQKYDKLKEKYNKELS